MCQASERVNERATPALRIRKRCSSGSRHGDDEDSRPGLRGDGRVRERGMTDRKRQRWGEKEEERVRNGGRETETEKEREGERERKREKKESERGEASERSVGGERPPAATLPTGLRLAPHLSLSLPWSPFQPRDGGAATLALTPSRRSLRTLSPLVRRLPTPPRPRHTMSRAKRDGRYPRRASSVPPPRRAHARSTPPRGAGGLARDRERNSHDVQLRRV